MTHCICKFCFWKQLQLVNQVCVLTGITGYPKAPNHEFWGAQPLGIICKKWVFLVTWWQKLVAWGLRALLEHSPEVLNLQICDWICTWTCHNQDLPTTSWCKLLQCQAFITMSGISQWNTLMTSIRSCITDRLMSN